MMWVYIIIGLVIVIGLVYWLKPKGKEEGADLSTPSTPPEDSQPAETEETPSDEERPM